MRASRRARLEDLYAAVAKGDTAGVREVLGREPDLVRASRKTPPPLHWAIYHNRPQVVELLLDAGADIGLRDPDRDATPLEYAVVYARRRIIRLLAARGADAGAGLPVALKGAGGGFAEFAELPSRGEYEAVATLLGELRGPEGPPAAPAASR